MTRRSKRIRKAKAARPPAHETRTGIFSRATAALQRRRAICIPILLLVTVCMGGIYLLAESRQGTGLGFPLDDPWIHFQFARNLAQGNGFCFNPGEPVAGSTSPLWTFLLTGIHLFVHDPVSVVLATKVLGIVIFSVAVLLSYLLVLRWTDNALIALLAALAVALTTHLNWGAVSGLEIPLYLALSVAVFYFASRTGNAGSRFMLSAVLALSVYARPECLLLFVFFLVDHILFGRSARKWTAIGQITLAYILLLLPYFLMNHSLSGTLFPHTFRVKVGGLGLLDAISNRDWTLLKQLLFSSGPHYFAGFIRHLFRANPLIPWGLILGSIFCVYHWKQAGRGQRSCPVLLLLPLTVLLYSFGIGVVAPFLGADFQNGRYIANQTGLAVVLAVLGYYWLVRSLLARRKGTAVALATVILLFAIYNTGVAQVFTVRHHARSVESINRIDVHLGKWVAANTPPDATVATIDIGALGYFSGRRILDLMGLVTPEVIPYIRQHASVDAATVAFVRDTRPDYLVVFPPWLPQLIQSTPHRLVARADMRENTASEWTFIPRAESLFGLILERLVLKPIPASMVVLQTRWEDGGHPEQH